MDRQDLDSPEAKKIINELNNLISELYAQNVKISSWYGTFELIKDPYEWINRGYGYAPFPDVVDDKNFPWFLYWEIVWIILHNDFKKGQRLLDLGGSSSLFSYYLASKGLDVTTVDLQKELVDNGNVTAKKMGWDLKNHMMDMRKLDFDATFDHITSVCVFEHIPMYDRVEINKIIKELLNDNGHFSITFDYRNPIRLARIHTKQDVHDQFVVPSGLTVRGNKAFVDEPTDYLLSPFYYKKRLFRHKLSCIRNRHYSPWEFFKTKTENDYTFAALFMRKEA